MSFGDASFASSRNLHSHQGVILGATSVDLQHNVEAPFAPLKVSKRISGGVLSTLSTLDLHAINVIGLRLILSRVLKLFMPAGGRHLERLSRHQRTKKRIRP